MGLESKSLIPMSTRLAVLVAVLLASAGSAFAQSDSTQTYAVVFEEITNSCTDANVAMRIDKATIEVSRQKETIRVSIPNVPAMTGRLRKGGSFKAEAEKRSPTTRNVEQRFSSAGRASDSKVQLVFVAEFYRDDKPLCTQSWDVTGPRK